MKAAIFSFAMVLLVAHPAFAGPGILKGRAADKFIAKHFPNADIPGPVSGAFAYVKRGRRATGHAKCFVPAMGARSEGAVSTCSVWY